MLLRTLPQALALALVLASGVAASDAPFRSVAPLGNDGPAGVESALGDALGRLLVRVTGRRGAADLLGRFPPASSIVRQYRVVDGNRLEAEFDEAMVRRVLEEAGEGIWAGERPALTLWLVANDGGRWLFRPPESSRDATRAPLDVRAVFSGAISHALSAVSALRGIELRHALPPDPVAASQCAEALWTGSFACLPETPGVLLLGRAAIPGAPEEIEWILRENGQWGRVWESDAAEAVHSVVDRLAARFMATQGPVRSYLLVVSPVPNLEAYVKLKADLKTLAVVREWRIDGAVRDALTFRITSRTAEAPLREALGALDIPFELSRVGA